VYQNDAFFDQQLAERKIEAKLNIDSDVLITKLNTDSNRFEIKAFLWVILMIGLTAPLKFTNLLVISDRTDARLDEYIVNHGTISHYLLGKTLSLGLIGLCATVILIAFVTLSLIVSFTVVLMNDPFLLDLASSKIATFKSTSTHSSFDDLLAILNIFLTILISKQVLFLLASYLFLVVTISQIYLFIQLYFTKEVTASWICTIIPYALIAIPVVSNNTELLSLIPFLNIFTYISLLIDGETIHSYSSFLLPNVVTSLIVFMCVNLILNRRLMNKTNIE
jgi:hypothetical protein